MRRIRLFIRDYFSELPVAWSIARTRDCERYGGHRWQPVGDDPVLGRARICSRCGCGESVPTIGAAFTSGTAASTASSYTLRY